MSAAWNESRPRQFFGTFEFEVVLAVLVVGAEAASTAVDLGLGWR